MSSRETQLVLVYLPYDHSQNALVAGIQKGKGRLGVVFGNISIAAFGPSGLAALWSGARATDHSDFGGRRRLFHPSA